METQEHRLTLTIQPDSTVLNVFTAVKDGSVDHYVWLRTLQYEHTGSCLPLRRLLVSLFVCLCPAHHNIKQSIPTRRNTKTTNAKPNLTVSTIMLRQIYVPILLGVPYSFTVFLYQCSNASRNAFPAQSPPSFRFS